MSSVAKVKEMLSNNPLHQHWRLPQTHVVGFRLVVPLIFGQVVTLDVSLVFGGQAVFELNLAQLMVIGNVGLVQSKGVGGAKKGCIVVHSSVFRHRRLFAPLPHVLR